MREHITGCGWATWWQSVHSVRMLSRSHRPPPRKTGTMWSACHALPSSACLTSRATAFLALGAAHVGATASSRRCCPASHRCEPFSIALQRMMGS